MALDSLVQYLEGRRQECQITFSFRCLGVAKGALLVYPTATPTAPLTYEYYFLALTVDSRGQANQARWEGKTDITVTAGERAEVG